jgi:hypothetical protein
MEGAMLARKTRAVSVLLILLLGGIVLPACGRAGDVPAATLAPGGETQPSEATTGSEGEPGVEEPAATPAPMDTGSGWRVGPSEYPEGVDPLTGLQVEDPSLLERRPLMIKVSNFPVAGRPHAGLAYADLVFEYFIGVGMTRFNAIYYGQDSPRTGPIRSGRLVDGQITSLYGGILGMVSASQYVWDFVNAVLGERVVSATATKCPALCIEGSTNTYSVFSDTAALTQYVVEHGIDNRRPDLSGMLFDIVPPQGGEEATRLWLFYANLNQVAWDYDPQRGVYLRSQDNADAVLKPMPDRLTGEQLAFENVVVLFAYTTVEETTRVDINLWDASDGQALIFRDGLVYWAKFGAVSRDKPLRFYDAAGNPFAFKPGRTWFEVVGVNSTVDELETGSWKVRAYFP